MMSIKRLVAAFVLTLAAVSAAFAIPAPWVPLLWQTSAVHDGISLDFANQRYYTKAPGAAARVAAFTDLFTVTRNSVGSFEAASGLVEYANENRSIRSAPTSAQLGVSIGVTDDSSTVWGVFPTGTAGISFGDNSITRAAYTNSALIVGGTGSTVTASVYVKMGDNSAPVLGVDASTGDFAILTNGLYPSAHTSFSQECRLVALTNIYRCVLTFVQAASGANNYGVIKTNTHSAKTFIVTGFQYQLGRSAGPLLTTTGTAKYDQPRIEYKSTTTGTNYLLQSQSVNVTWTLSGATISANSATAPDGTVTADKIVESAGGTFHLIRQDTSLISVGRTNTFSTYLQASGRGFSRVQFTDTSEANGCFVDVNLSSGATGSVTAIGTGASQAATVTLVSGYYRVALTCSISSTATTGRAQVLLANALGTVSYSGDGTSGVNVWGNQVEAGSAASNYAVTTTAAPQHVNSSPVALGYFSEAARTNLSLQAEVVDDAAWTKSNTSITANSATAPDGSVTADTVVENGATAQHLVQQINVAGLTASTVYTASKFVKSGGRTRGRLLFIDSAQTDGVGVSFDLVAGTSAPTVVFGTGTLTASGITPYANGWFRVWVSGAMNNAKTAGGIYLNTRDGAGNDSYLGDTVSGFYVWGGQLEAGAFPTSYIPTTAASVPRAADSGLRTLGPEFSATAGTVVVAGRASGGQSNGADDHFWSFDDGTANEIIRLFRVNLSDNSQTQFRDGGVTQAGLNATFSNLTTFKSADAWSLDDFARSFNGAAVTTDALGTIPTMTTVRIGSGPSVGPSNGHILRFDYYPTRLPNDFLVRKSTPGPQSFLLWPANDNERRSFG